MLVQKKIKFSIIIFLFSSCYNDNKEIISEAKSIKKQYSKDLEKLEPIIDNIFNDSCNIFFICMSPTTDLFYIEQGIEHLYDSLAYNEVDIKEQNLIRNYKPSLKLNDIAYLKNIFYAYAINQADHPSLIDCYLLRIVNRDKFNKVYPNFRVIQDVKKGDQSTNWLYFIDKSWAVCSGSLIHSGTKQVCNLLKK